VIFPWDHQATCISNMTLTQQNQFAFVSQDPKKRFSKETQTIIRKQAMRAVGAARRRPTHSSSTNPSHGSRGGARLDLEQPSPLPPMPLSGLELLVKDCGLDPIDLSALTCVHVGSMSVRSVHVGLRQSRLIRSFLLELHRYFHQSLIVCETYFHAAKSRISRIYHPASGTALFLTMPFAASSHLHIPCLYLPIG
jgi:hypothetical protein